MYRLVAWVFIVWNTVMFSLFSSRGEWIDAFIALPMVIIWSIILHIETKRKK